MAAISSNHSSTSHSNSTIDPTQDLASIYYLHPSDHASTKLVSNLFDGSGYGDWKRSVIIGLTAKNKMSFINNTLPKPTNNSVLQKAWERCNNMVIGWLIASLDRNLSKSIMYYCTAAEIWKDLEDRFGQSSCSQLYGLHEDLATLSQSAGMTIADYFTKAKSLWDELDNFSPIPTCTCDGCSCNLTKRVLKMQQEHRIMQFLMKVDPKYNQVRTNILMMDDLPNASVIYPLLQQEERHKEVSKLTTNPTDSMVFAVDRKQYYQRHSDHHTQDRSISGNKRHASYVCEHCKIPGHSIERCFKIHSYPPNSRRQLTKKIATNMHTDPPPTSSDVKETSLTQAQFNHLLTLLGKKDVDKPLDVDTSTNTTSNLAGISYFTSYNSYSHWIIDIGATDHMCNNLSVFTNITPVTSAHCITIPDGSILTVSKQGDILLDNDITLTKVLYVPQLHFNLISASKLCLDYNC